MKKPSDLRQVTKLTDKFLTSWIVPPGVVRGCAVTKGQGWGLNVEKGACFTANGTAIPVPQNFENVISVVPATIKEKTDYVVVIAENGSYTFRYVSGELMQNKPMSPLSLDNGVLLARIRVKYPTNSMDDVFIYNSIPSDGEKILYSCRAIAVADGMRRNFMFPADVTVNYAIDLRIGGVPQREVTDFLVSPVEGPDRQPYVLVEMNEAVPVGVDIVADLYCGKVRFAPFAAPAPINVNATGTSLTSPVGTVSVTLDVGISGLLGTDIQAFKDGQLLSQSSDFSITGLTTLGFEITFTPSAGIVHTSDITLVITKQGYVINSGLPVNILNEIPEPNLFPGGDWYELFKLDDTITAMCEAADGSLIIGTGADKIYRTVDLVNFSHVADTGAWYDIKQIFKTSTGTLLLAGDSKRSTDNGLTWNSIVGIPYATNGTYAFCEPTPGVIICAASYYGSWVEISRSLDDGLTFSYVLDYTDGLNHYPMKLNTSSPEVFMTSTSTGSGSEIMHIVQNPDGVSTALDLASLSSTTSSSFAKLSDGSLLVGIGNTLYRSNVGATSWQPYHTFSAAIGDIYSDSLGNVLVSVSSGSHTTVVYKSGDDFGTFTPSQSIIDGGTSYVMLRLSTGRMLLGTDGNTKNLWTSIV